MKKFLITTTLIIIAVVLVLVLARNIVVKVLVEGGMEKITGLELKIKSFDINLKKASLGIKELRLFNPKGYREKTMLHMPDFYADYDLPSILTGKVHFEEINLYVKEFFVEKNEKGELNLDSLKSLQGDKKTSGKKKAKKKIQIDRLRLRIGKVVYRDYSGGGGPTVKEYQLNIDQEFRNIDDPDALVRLIVFKALVNTSIAYLTGFDLNALSAGIPSSITGAVGGALGAGKEIGKTGAGAAKGVLEKTTEGLKKLFR
jgi:uncharacterized protein involved in outer membrane biogenesis